MKFLPAALLFVTSILTFSIGCSSNSTDPLQNFENDIKPQTQFPANTDSASNRSFLGSWIAEYDKENIKMNVIPDRESMAHWNVTTLIPAPSIQVISYDPASKILEVDVTITNPFNIDGYDLRLIIFTDNSGNMLKNPDGWIMLYDIPGGLPVNPFKAYAKHVWKRLFAAHSQHTQRLQIYFPHGITYVKFAIDASYPSNCDEPYEAKHFTQGILYDEIGSSASITLDVYDWQNDTSSVYLCCPAITGVNMLFLSQKSTTQWHVTLLNNTGAPAGIYFGYFVMTSPGSIQLFHPVNITITELVNEGWVKTWGSAGYDAAYDLAVDNNDFILVSGRYGDTIDLDPGPDILEFESVYNSDVSISKFNSYGELEWADGWNVFCLNDACPVAIDSSNNIFLIGSEVSLRKYNPAGTSIWTKNLPDLYAAYDLEINSSGMPHFTGDFKGEADFDPDSGTYIINSFNNTYDSYMNVLDQNGAHERTITFRSLYDGGATALAFHDFDACMIAGFFRGTTDFDSGPGTYWKNSTGTLLSFTDAYLAKYTSTGTFEWVQTWGGGLGMETPSDVKIDKNGNIYVAGNFFDSVDFDPDPVGVFNLTTKGGFDMYISIFDSTGDFVTTITLGSPNNDYINALAVDDDLNIYLTGSFRETIDLDPGMGQDNHTSIGGSDLFVLKLDSYHELVWAHSFGSTSDDAGFDITLDSYGNIYIVGDFSGAIDFKPGPDVETHSTVGYNDAFLMKLLPNGLWE